MPSDARGVGDVAQADSRKMLENSKIARRFMPTHPYIALAKDLPACGVMFKPPLSTLANLRLFDLRLRLSRNILCPFRQNTRNRIRCLVCGTAQHFQLPLAQLGALFQQPQERCNPCRYRVTRPAFLVRGRLFVQAVPNQRSPKRRTDPARANPYRAKGCRPVMAAHSGNAEA